jgi:hypothetical protein
MNIKENDMLDTLKKLRDESGVVAVKAEFEAEGTRVDELLRLIEITRKAQMKIVLKIGGCEAVKDLMESKQLGVDCIIAPMVETPYALSKFIDAKNKVYSNEEQLDKKFLFNLETITAFNNLTEMTGLAVAAQLDGLVFGRVDFSGSLNLSRQNVNTDVISKYCFDTAKECKKNNLEVVVGGAISIDALDVLREINDIHLSRFETRKIVFDSSALSNSNIQKGLLQAVKFELLWLLNKRDYYSRIMEEDKKRIDLLENRWKVL